jgi:hypothetical protein
MAEGFELKYKSDSTLPLLHRLITQRWRRKSTAKAAAAAYVEVSHLRYRLYLAVTELQEWRLKVGGANYSARGPQFYDMVETGIRNITGETLRITDDDYYPR